MTTTLLESHRSQNTHFRAQFRQTSYKDLVFARGEFLSVVGQNTQFMVRFRQTSYKDLVFARGVFLSVVRAQNESLRIILMHYMFKY